MSGENRGITTVTLMARSLPWYARPRAWLPAEAEITPRVRSPAPNCMRALRAPRSLKLPVRCR